MSLALKYIVFSIFSIFVNLLFQYITFSVYGGYGSLYMGILIGTSISLVLKYILDKKYIFYYKTQTVKEDSKNFFLYTLMGVFTTSIFWYTEVIFDMLFENENSKYVGAVVGLSLGYSIKYVLDKKFVFRSINESK